MTTRIITGDCREALRTLPDASVQCCVTSPPYYNLRDYGMDGQIGAEISPDAYVEQLVACFQEVRRVLCDDGVVFLNLGDSYNNFRVGRVYAGLKEKDRMMIPARTAIALQSDGWYLRDEIVWHKPRPTPFPANDRTVSAHEMIYLLAKRAHYFFDWAAIEEPAAFAGLTRHAGKAFRDLAEQDPNAARKRASADRDIVVRETRRKRSVWSVSPAPYKDGHFATMPPDIAETCILAGSRTGDMILDPFAGAGTTGLVADRLGRHSTLIELNPKYCEMISQRIRGDAGLFAEVAA